MPGTVEPDPPFLEPEPPPWAARALATTLLAVAAIAAVASVVVRVPETVTGRVVLVPEAGIDPVRAPREGRVLRVGATATRGVALGDTLYVVASEPAGERGAERRALEATLAAAPLLRADLLEQEAAYARADSIERGRLDARIVALERSLAEKREQLDIVRDLETRARAGQATGAVSAVDVANTRLTVSRALDNLSATEGELDQARAQRARLRYESEARSADLRERLRRADLETRSAAARLEGLRAAGTAGPSALVVASPCSGSVVRRRVQREGAIVQQGDVLAEVACGGGTLYGDVTLPAASVSRVRPGQVVRLLYAAFPYQRHGVRYGTVEWVGPAGIATARGDSTGFRARVRLVDTALVIDGAPRRLEAGMDGSARIVVARRRLVSYAFEPLRQLKEVAADLTRPEAAAGGSPSRGTSPSPQPGGAPDR